MYVSLKLFLLISTTLAIPKLSLYRKKMRFPPKQKGSLDHITFEGYSGSQDLCEDHFQYWWDNFKLVRTAIELPRGRPLEIFDNEVEKSERIVYAVKSMMPPPRLDLLPPVQSIRARYGLGRISKASIKGSIDEVHVLTRDCAFDCEDLRSMVELWLTSRLGSRQPQTRSKGVFRLRCPETQLARIVQARDRRELETDLTRSMESIIQLLDPEYKGEDTYKSHVERKVGERPVTQCVCEEMEEDEEELDDELDGLIRPAQCTDMENMGFKPLPGFASSSLD